MKGKSVSRFFVRRNIQSVCSSSPKFEGSSISGGTITVWRSEVSPRRSRSMTDYRVSRGEIEEDQLTAAIEKSTSKIPSSAYLALALGTMAVSACFQAWNRKHESIFVGQWVAPFLLLGIYNKLVKQHGSDGRSFESREDSRNAERELSHLTGN
jgi:hypothetical protein